MIGVRIDVGLAERARKKAEAENRNISQVVRMLLESWLKRKAA